jgi:parallel beta-helix repeat protein
LRLRGLRSLGKTLLAFAAGAAGILGAWWYSAPFLLLRLLPEPSYETFVIEGAAASNQVIDLQGQWVNEGKLTEVRIRSVPQENGWSRPQNITIRNGKLRGSIRIMGLGRNGEAEAVRESSLQKGHTERAQSAAPTNIKIENLLIEADSRIPLYIAPGVTDVTVRNCTFTGRSVSTAIYLCAESAGNTIAGNTFATKVGREVIAVDGSARNRIIENTFENLPFGGIYLYRNCGEGGTVRHQTPRENLIEGNIFEGCPRWSSYGIWLGSRGGWSPYCGQDSGHPFGSSADNRDFADDNTVTGNTFAHQAVRTIRDDGRRTHIAP